MSTVFDITSIEEDEYVDTTTGFVKIVVGYKERGRGRRVVTGLDYEMPQKALIRPRETTQGLKETAALIQKRMAVETKTTKHKLKKKPYICIEPKMKGSILRRTELETENYDKCFYIIDFTNQRLSAQVSAEAAIETS